LVVVPGERRERRLREMKRGEMPRWGEGMKKRRGENDTWAHVAPIFFFAVDMWAHGFYYFSEIELPRKRHVNPMWDEDLASQTSHVGATSAKTAFQTAKGPHLRRF
jgi:hypothetical protein